MAEYTIELCDLIDLESGNIGLDSYPIFDPAYRPLLNEKIIEHFWNREIGVESVSMFRQQLRKKMHEIMPMWNQHYKASLIEFDPLKTISIKSISDTVGAMSLAGENAATMNGETDSTGSGESETIVDGSTGGTLTGETETIVDGSTGGTTASEGTSASSSDSKARAVASNLPQVMLSGNGDYAESAQDNISNTTATGESTESQTVTGTEDRTTAGTETQTTTGTEDKTTTGTESTVGNVVENRTTTGTESSTSNSTGNVDTDTTGYQGNPATLIAEFRANFVNTDMDVINQLEPLFMGIWGSTDSYIERGYPYYAYSLRGFAF